MHDLLRRFFTRETLRYLIFGVLTVVVNIAAYHLLVMESGILAANTTAFFIAVLFAYFTNSKYVFQVPFTWKSFLEFMSMRLGTLVIDDGGMMLFTWWGWDDLLAKCVVNVVIIALNYLFSKLLIFRRKDTEE